jgi:hypothetical protein
MQINCIVFPVSVGVYCIGGSSLYENIYNYYYSFG